MTRLAISLFFAFLVLAAIGWTSNAFAVFEITRTASVVCLMVSLLLFIVAYVRTPEAPGESKP